MNTCAWNNDGARAFAAACANLDLHGATAADVERLARRMPMLTFYEDGTPIGGMIVADGDVHIGVLEQSRGHWINKSVLSEMQWALKSAHTALIAHGNFTARRFARKLGWAPVGTKGQYVVYKPQNRT